MTGGTAPTGQVDAIVETARHAEQAMRQLNRMTIDRPTLLPADIDLVLAHLAGVIAALPQAASQLAEMLATASQDLDLTMDSLTVGEDPVLAIDTARLLLEGVREPAVEVFRSLDGAHNQVAHISTAASVAPVAPVASPSSPSLLKHHPTRAPGPADPSPRP